LHVGLLALVSRTGKLQEMYICKKSDIEDHRKYTEMVRLLPRRNSTQSQSYRDAMYALKDTLYQNIVRVYVISRDSRIRLGIKVQGKPPKLWVDTIRQVVQTVQTP
jgi:hypothetical protein